VQFHLHPAGDVSFFRDAPKDLKQGHIASIVVSSCIKLRIWLFGLILSFVGRR
jgi:hypothetical protein